MPLTSFKWECLKYIYKCFYVLQNHAGQWIIILVLLHFIYFMEAVRGQRDLGTRVNDFKSEATFDL